MNNLKPLKAKPLFALILFLFTISSASSQELIKGNVIDKETGLILAYVNIGIENKNVGTVSNQNGDFTLNLNKNVNNNDKVIFSHIGYKPQMYSVSFLLNKANVILLEPETNVLEEVVIAEKVKMKDRKSGRTGTGLGLMVTPLYVNNKEEIVDNIGRELGLRFKHKRDCYINSLNFNISANHFKNVKFRVNIYDVKNGLPDKLIINQDILFEIKDAYTGWFNLDLTSYDIYLRKELSEIAVTLQWLESEKLNKSSHFFWISAATSTYKRLVKRENFGTKWKGSKNTISFYLDMSCNQ